MMRQLATIILAVLTFASFAQDKDSSNTGHIFVSEPMPAYPGGIIEMNKFIKKNLKYPKDSEKVQGKVYVGFVVNEDGSLSDFTIVKGLGDSYDNSALAAVKKMPNWIPAKKDNKPIRTKMIIPITFD